jgi:hypothetical protein
MVKRRRGGQELPDELQDRPEQNAGYDDAVEHGSALDTQDNLEAESLERNSTGDELSVVNDDINVPDPDEAAALDAAREVRRRERSNR